MATSKVLFIIMIASACCWPALLSGANDGEKGIAVLPVGEVDKSIVDRTVGYLRRSYHCPVRSLKAVPKTATDPMAKLAKAKHESEDACLVAIVGIDEKSKSRVVVSPSKGIAFLNLPSFRIGLPSGSGSEELYARRIEKEAVNAVAQLLGLPHCPVIRCARLEAKVPQILDAKSRSLCPPCQMKARKSLREKGVKLTFDVDPKKASPKKK